MGILIPNIFRNPNQHLPHPAKPQNVTGKFESDGAVSIAFDAVEGAKSYLIHYADANQSDPKQAIYMGYTESNAWTLFSSKVPEIETGDKLYFYVQAYDETGIGSNDVEKAQYLHDGEFTGSAWSEPVILTKA